MKEENLYTGDEYIWSPEDETEDENTLTNKMVGIGKPFFRAEFVTLFRKKRNSAYVTMMDIKLLYMAFSKIKWSKGGNSLEIRLKKHEVCEVLDIPDDRHALYRLRRAANHMMEVSKIEMDRVDRKLFSDGFLVTSVEAELDESNIIIQLNEKYRAFLENLSDNREYLIMWVNDIYGFTSTFSYLLYEDMRMHSDSRRINRRFYTDEEIKKVFRLPLSGPGSYMHTVKGSTQFNRSEFEKKVLTPAAMELAKCKMLLLLPQEIPPPADGSVMARVEDISFYKKIKHKGRVLGYEFKYRIKSRRGQDAEKPEEEEAEREEIEEA